MFNLIDTIEKYIEYYNDHQHLTVKIRPDDDNNK